MNLIHTLKTAALACLVVTSLAGMQAHAESDMPSMTVRYTDLDLNTPEGANALYKRLQVAARSVCQQYDRPDLIMRAHFKNCIDHALTNAVSKVNRPQLSALHRRHEQNWS